MALGLPTKAVGTLPLQRELYTVLPGRFCKVLSSWRNHVQPIEDEDSPYIFRPHFFWSIWTWQSCVLTHSNSSQLR